MRTLWIVLLAAVGSATASDPPVPRPRLLESVPADFLGEWSSDLADCGSPNNESVLKIESTHISYYDRNGPLNSVLAYDHCEDNIELISELSSDGEKMCTITREQFRLDQDQLIAILDGGDFVRYRCPVSAAP